MTAIGDARARALRTPRAARSFTFSVDKKAGRLERLSSVTGGYHQDWTDRLTGYELIEAGWLTFLRENTKNMDGMWTSPFIDASGSGLIMSYAKPLYYGDKFLGVATKDINLATLEKKLLYGTWGTAYAFLTNREAETMVHPNLEPPSHISADPVFPDIGELETQGGAPAAFLTDVRAQLIAGASGSAAMDAIRLVPRGTALDGFDAVTDAVVYWWDVVARLGLCRVLRARDARRRARAHAALAAQLLGHRHGVLRQARPVRVPRRPRAARRDDGGRAAAAYAKLDPVVPPDEGKYAGVKVTFNHSTFKVRVLPIRARESERARARVTLRMTRKPR